MDKQRIIVSISNGLYYRLVPEKTTDDGSWKQSQSTIVCHENQLENKIADILRGTLTYNT